MEKMVFKQMLFGFILMLISIGALILSQVFQDRFMQNGLYLVSSTLMFTTVNFTTLANS